MRSLRLETCDLGLFDFDSPAVGVLAFTILYLAQQVVKLLHDRADLLAAAMETVPAVVEPDFADRREQYRATEP